MSRPTSRRYRTPEGAKRASLSTPALTSRPVQEVRRFRGEHFDFLATHISPGKWMIHGRSVPAEELAGLPSTPQQRRPGADGGWSKGEEQ